MQNIKIIFRYNITGLSTFSENFDFMTKSLLFGNNPESNKIKIFRKKNGKSSYIWLDKFPNEQFKQTFGTTSQNGLKVSLYSSWHFSCNNLPVVFQIVFTLQSISLLESFLKRFFKSISENVKIIF
jgi:hypothetical protein